MSTTHLVPATPAKPSPPKPQPAAKPQSHAKLFSLTLQLTLTALVVYLYQLENDAFLKLLCLIIPGFVIHDLLPMKWRLPAFVVLSLAGIVLVLGLAPAAWLIGLGLVLIAVCHLPVPMLARVALLLIIGSVLAVMRIGWTGSPWSAAIWPVLGSMFMFRLINYLYDLHHKAAPVGISRTLAYFFLLPNVCFPLFPVVDYKTFVRNYYEGDRHSIYQTGATWIWRGIVQLLLYRVVYYYCTYDPVTVTNYGELVGHMLSTYGLYLKVSGQFHVIVGILHLFGFKLPETHHRYYFANSFTDFWRRINIYWKDFMLKVFYMPIYFRMKNTKGWTALIVATLLTFVATWALHAYQWFWIQGKILVEPHDILFWSILAALVLVNSMYEVKYGRQRSLSKKTRTLGSSVSLVLRTIGTFIVICTLWSMWNSESLEDWSLLLSWANAMPNWSVQQWLLGSLTIVAVICLSVVSVWKDWERRYAPGPAYAGVMVVVPAALLCLVGVPEVNHRLGRPGEFVASLQTQILNNRDAAEFQRGYYEDLLAVERNTPELAAVYAQAAPDFLRSLKKAGLARDTDDFLSYELKPNMTSTFRGKTLSTNEWGMRDKSYSKQCPEDCYRFALVGASHEMGTGIGDGSTFESVVEGQLNQQASQYESYEILNFAVGAYTPLHELFMLESRVFDFEPQAVIYAGHSVEKARLIQQLIKIVAQDTPIPYPELRAIIKKSGVDREDGPNVARRKLLAHSDQILTWLYGRVVSSCRERNVRSVFLYVPGVVETVEPWRVAEHAEVMKLARAAGFDVVIDLKGVYNGHKIESLWIAENDQHANEMGNRMLADRLLKQLIEKNDALGLGLNQPSSRETSFIQTNPH